MPARSTGTSSPRLAVVGEHPPRRREPAARALCRPYGPRVLRPAAVLLAALLATSAVPASAATPEEVLAVDRRQTVLTTSPPEGDLAPAHSGQTPAVSPDGERVAFAEPGPEHSMHLWTSRRDGSDLRQVTTGRFDDAWPAWSPDGSTLAFLRDSVAGRVVATVPAAGGVVRTLAAGYSPPTWSPDGAFVAYGSGGGIWLATSDGRQTEQLLTGEYGDPEWSPDGTRLLVGTHAGRVPTIETWELATSATRTVAVGEWQQPVVGAVWSGDGRTAYYVRGGSPPTVHRADVETGVTDPAFTVVDASSPSLGGGPRVRPGDATAPGPVTDLVATPQPSRVVLSYALPPDRDRAGVVVRYAQGSTPPATPDAGLDGGRAYGRAVVPRLLADTTYSFAVFARDWSGNLAPAATVTATTPHQVATTFRTSASRARIVCGQTVVLGARLVREDTGQPVAGARVQVLGRTAGTSDALIATATTDEAGLALSTRRPVRTTRYTLRYAGDGQLLPGSGSPLVEVQVALGVAVPSPVAKGSRAVVEAAVRPAQPRAVVTVTLVSAAGRVIDAHRVAQDADGRLRTGISTAVAGSHRVYVHVPDTAGNRGVTVSRPLVVR